MQKRFIKIEETVINLDNVVLIRPITDDANAIGITLSTGEVIYFDNYKSAQEVMDSFEVLQNLMDANNCVVLSLDDELIRRRIRKVRTNIDISHMDF